jgi:ABC-2 type transport system ATP-binding protein
MQIEVRELQRHFGKAKAVDGISFGFASGDICGFVGPNGAGKTTTMRVMATLDEPSAGDVLLDGVSLIDHPELGRQHIGFVPDNLPEYADMTVHEYLDFFARAYGLRGARRRQVVARIEEFTGVEPLHERLLRQLSKGMKQRVCLGRALVHDPGILVLDEPAAGLDPRARIELRELLFLLAREGKAIFISSHILAELTEICNAVVIIERGRLVESGILAEVTRRNRSSHRVLIRVGGDAGATAALARELPGVEQVALQANGIQIEVGGADEVLAAVLRELVAHGCPVVEFRLLEDDLEDVFMRVTKGEVA